MSLYHEWLAKIRENEKQWEAFQKDGHTVVIAGPGSGKTRILAIKIAQLLRDEIAPPRGVACLTYTQMMAKELETRLSLLGVVNRPNVLVGTIHSFCLGQVVLPFAEVFNLGIPQPVRIAPVRVWESCLDQARRKITNIGYNPEERADNEFKSSLTKYHLQNIDFSYKDWKNQEFAQILQTHYSLLREKGYVDFDLIVKAALILIAHHDLVRQSIYAKFAWLAVDEYQDLGYPLFRIITNMIDHTPIKLFAIGDPDQSIFDFVGTDPKYLIELANRPDMQAVVKLAKNYRATAEIVAISKAVRQPYCDYHSLKTGGACHVYETDPYEQSQKVVALAKQYLIFGIPPNRIAILHRARETKDGLAGVNILARELQQAEIEFSLDKNPSYDRNKVLIKWLENLGYWCLEGFKEHDAVTKSFNDLVVTWTQITYPHAMKHEENSEIRIKLMQTIWLIMGKDMLLNEWLFHIANELQFNSTLEEYQKIFPDEVEELTHLKKITQPHEELSRMRLSDFVNLTRGIQLTTLHSSKGMEFEVVIIAGVERIWNTDNDNRLLYVGVTRAEREVCLIYSKVWPKSAPRTPPYIENLTKKCGHLSYFHHYPLNRAK